MSEPQNKTDIKESDEASRKWGAKGHPSGTFEEVKPDGKLEIGTAGKNLTKETSGVGSETEVDEKMEDVAEKKNGVEKNGTPDKPVATGEKHGRSEDDEGEIDNSEPAKEQAEAEKEAGKETKKPKVVAKTQKKTKGSESNGVADEKNGTTNGSTATSTANGGAPKKRGPGRPKKSEKTESNKAAPPEDAPARRTRSKA